MAPAVHPTLPHIDPNPVENARSLEPPDEGRAGVGVEHLATADIFGHGSLGVHGRDYVPFPGRAPEKHRRRRLLPVSDHFLHSNSNLQAFENASRKRHRRNRPKSVRTISDPVATGWKMVRTISDPVATGLKLVRTTLDPVATGLKSFWT